MRSREALIHKLKSIPRHCVRAYWSILSLITQENCSRTHLACTVHIYTTNTLPACLCKTGTIRFSITDMLEPLPDLKHI